jgi:hypothetical protein
MSMSKSKFPLRLLAQGQDGVLDFLPVVSEGQVDIALRFDVDVGAAEQAIDE